MTDPQTPPGWYPTPDGRQRYWDGSQWTQHFAGPNPAQVPLPPKKGGALKWVLIGLGIFFVLGLGSCIAFIAAVGNDTSTAFESISAELETGDAPSETPDAPQEAALVVTAQKLIQDLEANALAASQTYKGKRVTVTGTLDNIDASGDYFTLRGTEEFSFTNVQVFIDDDLVKTVSGFKADQEVTVTGEITDVGEIMGYEIKAETIG